MGPKQLRIKFIKINRFWIFIVLIDYGLFFDKICDKIKYLISEKKKWYYR